ALLVADLAAARDAADDPVLRDGVHRQLGLPVGEDDAVAGLDRVEEAAEVEEDLALRRDAAAGAAAHLLADLEVALPALEARQAPLRPLDVGQDPDRAHARVRLAPDALHAAQEVLLGPVAEVDPRDRHAGVDQVADALLGGRADRGDDLGVREIAGGGHGSA